MRSAIRNVLRNPLILPFYLPALLYAFSQGLLVPVLPLYAKDLGGSYGLVGLVLGAQGIGTLLSDIPTGMVLRHMGQKRAMLLGLASVGLSTAALSWAGSVPEVVMYRLIAGFGLSLYNIARHAYVTNLTAVAVRGRTMSLMGGIYRVGWLVGPVVGGMIASNRGLRVPFVWFGVASALTVLVVALFVRAGDAGPGPEKRIPGTGNHLGATLKTHWGVLASAGMGQLFAQMIRTGRGVIIPLYGADVIGLDVEAIGYVVSFSSAVDMSLFWCAGLIMDRLGRKFAVVPSFTIQAIGMFLVPFTGSLLGLLLAASLIGFGNGFSAGAMLTLGADLSPQEARGEFLGMWRLIGDAGATGAPLVVGGVADLLALPTAAWVISMTGLMAALIFLLFVPETLKKRRRTADGL